MKIMSTMIAEVYDAFKDAGASEEKAKAAAGALAEYESRFDKVDAKLTALDAKVEIVKAEVVMVKWMMGVVMAGIITLLAGTAALVLRAFWPPA